MYRRQPPRRHACNRCVQLKVKCVPVGPGACQRCLRLGHPSSCVFPANVRGNNTPKPDSQQPSPTNQSTAVHEEDVGPIFHEAIDTELANKLLSKYRAHKMSQFPFVIIPPEVDLATLRQQSPFLLLCILTASLEHDLAIQDALEALVRKEVADRLIVNVERNMDLLQGLLVHAAWYHYHWRTYHTHIYMLLQMAIMVVVDLGLDRQESFRMQVIPIEGKEAADQARGSSAHTVAGQRALLGCYYLCSNSSIFRRQLDMRHTTWIDQCAGALSEKAECSTDLHLKQYIEVRSLARQNQMLFDEERRGPNHAPFAIWGRAIGLVTHHQAQTKDVMSSLDTNSDWALRIELGATATLVLGQALRRRRDVFKLQEMNHLGTLTASAHYVVDTFLSVPSAAVIHLPTSTFTTIWYALLSLSKLSLLFHPSEHQAIGVDKNTIHSKGVAIVRKFEELSLGADVWTSSKKVVGNMLAWLDKTNNNITAQFGPDSWQGQGTYLESQPVWPPSDSPEHVASMDMQFQLSDELDAAVWQQMLDSFTWVGPVTENDRDITALP
ncbi:hypothetical protein BDW59DRAFT_163665 [Aspergillus cavernicola]|uniref:Zn(2)-C6 fungal-type domain-containing protein n=1 Tax=Aspergillus cavernicola TaxID=176166 RepID=A0ABR4I4J3_9EURO